MATEVRYVVHEPGTGYIRETDEKGQWLVNSLESATLFTTEGQAREIVKRLQVERPHYEVLPVYVEITLMRLTATVQ